MPAYPSRVAATDHQIRLRVTLHADLRKYLPRRDSGSRALGLPPGSTVADLLRELGISESEIVTVGINGELAQRDAVLNDNDDVAMFSPMEGG